VFGGWWRAVSRKSGNKGGCVAEWVSVDKCNWCMVTNLGDGKKWGEANEGNDLGGERAEMKSPGARTDSAL